MTETETQALHLALAALDERLEQLAEAAEETGQRITRLEGKTKAMHARFEQHRKDMIGKRLRSLIDERPATFGGITEGRTNQGAEWRGLRLSDPDAMTV